VSARRLGQTAGYRLDLRPLHPLRYAGFEDGDFVHSADGHPLGSADAWAHARAETRDQRRCAWEVVRQGRRMVLEAELVSWPAPEPPRVQPDGSVIISRSALALALLAIPQDLPQGLLEGPYYPYAIPELRQLMAAAGIPERHAVQKARGETIRTTTQLVEVLAHFLIEDQLDFVLRDPLTGESRDLSVLASGPEFPVPRGLPQPPADRQVILADADLMRILEESLTAWSLGQRGACVGLPHRDEDGKLDGYRLSAIKRGSPFHQMGLRNGDILQEVDRVQLHSDALLQAVAETLRDASWVEIGLLRRGQPLTLVLDTLSP
jgi:hypothetical protein